jgi:hypothetical protein
MLTLGVGPLGVQPASGQSDFGGLHVGSQPHDQVGVFENPYRFGDRTTIGIAKGIPVILVYAQPSNLKSLTTWPIRHDR